MLLKLLREHQPDYIAVAFDVKGSTFRHDAYEGYKANRKAIPEALIPQIPCVKQIVQALGIPLLEQPGIEADDILGTLAAAHAGPDLQVVIVSGDKDLLQLVSEDVSLYDPMKEKRYDPAAVQERFGVVPGRVADILALAGDASDNIPGIPGIGPKGAERLIQEFGSVEGVLANTGKIRNARTKAAIEAHGDLARLSLELTRIRLDCEVDFDFEKSRRQKPDLAVLRELFREFEFSSLLQDLKNDSTPPTGHYETIEDEASLLACEEEIRASGAVALECLATPSDPLRASLFGLALSPMPGRAFYLPLEGTERKPSATSPPLQNLQAVLPPLLTDRSIQKYGHDLKTISLLLRQQGLSLEGLVCDTLLGAWCINPTRRGYALADVYREYADSSLAMPQELVSAGPRPPTPEAMTETERAAWACSRADAARNLGSILSTHMEKEGLKEVFHDIEMPLIPFWLEWSTMASSSTRPFSRPFPPS
jgi:DNA polymerase-1